MVLPFSDIASLEFPICELACARCYAVGFLVLRYSKTQHPPRRLLSGTARAGFNWNRGRLCFSSEGKLKFRSVSLGVWPIPLSSGFRLYSHSHRADTRSLGLSVAARWRTLNPQVPWTRITPRDNAKHRNASQLGQTCHSSRGTAVGVRHVHGEGIYTWALWLGTAQKTTGTIFNTPTQQTLFNLTLL